MGLKVWEQDTKSFPASFDVDLNGTVTFMDKLKKGANAMGWKTNVLTISVAQLSQAPAIICPVLTQYELISIHILWQIQEMHSS